LPFCLEQAASIISSARTTSLEASSNVFPASVQLQEALENKREFGTTSNHPLSHPSSLVQYPRETASSFVSYFLLNCISPQDFCAIEACRTISCISANVESGTRVRRRCDIFGSGVSLVKWLNIRVGSVLDHELSSKLEIWKVLFHCWQNYMSRSDWGREPGQLELKHLGLVDCQVST